MIQKSLVAAAVVAAGVAALGAQGGSPAASMSPEVELKTIRTRVLLDGNVKEAVERYRAVADRYRTSRPEVAAEAQLQMARGVSTLDPEAGRAAYQDVLREFADVPAVVAAARTELGPAPVGTQSISAPRLVLSDAGTAIAVSPDGSLLLSRDLDGRVIRNLLADAELRIPGGRPSDDGVFSWDGSEVLLEWTETAPGSRSSLRLARTRGALNVQVLLTLDERGRVIPLGWSADRRSVLAWIVSLTAAGDLAGYSIIALRLDSGVVSTLKQFGAVAGKGILPGGLSPDGGFVSYVEITPQPSDCCPAQIYVVDLTTGTENQVVGLTGSNTDPVWAPDGAHLLFTSTRTGTRGLWSVAVQSGKAVGDPVAIRASFDAYPVGISTADELFYTQEVQQQRQYVFVAERGVLGARALQAFNGEGVSWSPDGSSLAFLRNEYSGPAGISLMTKGVASGEERAYARQGGLGPQQTRWSPDGSGILVNVARQNDGGDGYGGLYLFDLKTEEYRLLVKREFPQAGGGIAELSPDGKTVYTLMRLAPGAPNAVVAIDTVSGERRVLYELPPSPNQAGALALSPDGSTLAIQTWAEVGTPIAPGKAQLTLVDVNSGAARSLTGPYPAITVWSNFAWLPDSQGILFTMAETPHNWRIMRVGIGGGPPVFDGLESSTAVAGTSLPDLFANILSLSVSPDGSRVAFGSYVRQKTELWSIGNVSSLLSR